MVRNTETAFVPNLRGGDGTIEIRHILNTEPYYVLKGKGIFEDNDHTETEIHPGDVCVIEVGQSHAIKNPFDEPLEIMALVINERGKEI